jgi:hypothetical protein
MRKKILFVIIIFLIGLTSLFLFLIINENKNILKRDQIQEAGDSNQKYAKVVGQIKAIRGDHIIVLPINNGVRDLPEGEISELKLRVDGATSVFALGDDLKTETTSQMAELKWEDYVAIQYDKMTEEVTKLIILKNKEVAIKEANK